MKPSDALNAHRTEIREIVAAHHGMNARVFGSTVRGEDGDGSDLDLLVDPTPKMTLLDIARIERLLEALLGVSVDVLTPKALPESFRDRVVAEAVAV